MALSVSQKAVVGAESTYGIATPTSADTAVVLNAAIPIETASLNLVIDPFNDQTKRGNASLDGQIYPTVRRVEGSVEGPFFNDECAYFLLALLGQDTVTTAASDQNTHVFRAKTDFTTAGGGANSLTMDIRDDSLDLEYTGLYVSSLTLRYSAAEGILTYTANLMGANQEAEGEGTALTMSDIAFAEPIPLFGWTAQTYQTTESRTANNHETGVVEKKSLVDAEFTFNRPTQLTYVARNLQTVFRADPGPLEVTARFTMDWDGGSDITPANWRDDYISSSTHQRGWRFDMTNNQSGSAARFMRIYLPSASVLEAPLEIDRSDTSMRVNIGVRAVNNSNAAITGPCNVSVVSRKAAIYGTSA